MSYPRERLQKFQRGVERLSQELPETIQPMFGLVQSTLKPGALTLREKELVAIGVSIYNRCEDCVVLHSYKALEAGCTRKEILEAAGTAMLFGAGPSLGSSASLLIDCLDEFEPDFAK